MSRRVVALLALGLNGTPGRREEPAESPDAAAERQALRLELQQRFGSSTGAPARQWLGQAVPAAQTRNGGVPPMAWTLSEDEVRLARERLAAGATEGKGAAT